MMRVFLVLFSTLLLLSIGQLASACFTECQDEFNACNARITDVNDIVVKDAKAVCNKDFRTCKTKCEAEESTPPQQVQPEKAPDEQQEKAPQEQAPQEQQKNDTINGNIKVYQFEK
jgi:hypothetical protein